MTPSLSLLCSLRSTGECDLGCRLIFIAQPLYERLGQLNFVWKEELCPDVLLKRKYVVRGGSWGDGPRSCRSAYRGDCDYLSDFDGFRVVASSRKVIQ